MIFGKDSHMKEIGGYFQLEQNSGPEYHTGLLRLNLGRTALLYLLQRLPHKKLYLPWFICDSVEQVCRQVPGLKIARYSITKDFLPVLPEKIEPDACVYLVNYYGALSDNVILELKKHYPGLIADYTHCFYQKPLPGIPTLYSCRKFFGLPDGAYLSCPPEYTEDFSSLPVDSSAERMAHILGRFEHSASDYYNQMLKTAESFYEEPVKRMSPLTRNLLQGIDYEGAAKTRKKNYNTLKQLLPSTDGPAFSAPEVPFVFPFYCKNAAALKKELAAHKIFVPTYWNNVIREMPETSIEWDYASHILPLPVDQRYTCADMEYMADIILHTHQLTGETL